MAGAGYKLFNTGDVLTAAQVNTYLMEQTVMRFATTTARDTALSGVLAEGMLCYIDADNNIYKYTGSAWVNIDTTGGGSPLTTKGDLYTYSTTDARLGVGNNGETLVADSSATTGLRWTPQSTVAGKNFIINGGMDIWQRGTSIAAVTSGYTADRWTGYYAPSGRTVSRQSVSDSTNLPFIQYCARIQRDSGNTNTTVIQFTTSLETVNSIPLAGRTVTVSFYARAGSNFSSASNVLNVRAAWGTGTDQNFVGTYTGATDYVNQNATLTTTWQRFIYTGTVGSTATEAALQFQYTPSGTAGANDYFEITGVQVEIGSVATTFSRAGGTLAGELAACQRYYYRATANANYAMMAHGQASSSTLAAIAVRLPVTMRSAPTVVDYSTLRLSDESVGYAVTNLTVNTNCYSKDIPVVDATVASGLTAQRYFSLQANNSTSAYLGLAAEL